MTEVKENPACGFSETLVSYAYGEAAESEKHAFDAHLASCVECRAELAAFRGLHDAFGTLTAGAVLETPLVNPAHVTGPSETRRSLWETLAALMTLTPRSFAAAVVLIAVVGFVAFVSLRNGMESSSLELASNIAGPTQIPEIEIASKPVQPAPAESGTTDGLEARSSAPSRNTPDSDTLKAKSTKSTRARKVTPAQTTEATTLSEIDESSDDSLRLSDIFAELSMD